MGRLKIILLVACLCIGLATSVSARVQTRSKTKLSENDPDKFQTLPKIDESSEHKGRTLLDEDFKEIPNEDDEDIIPEGSGQIPREKDGNEVEDDDEDYYLDEEDYEDDEDIYDDEDEDYSGDYAYDDEEYDDDDEDDEDYDDEEYISEKDVVKKIKDNKNKDKFNRIKPILSTSQDDDLHFDDDDDIKKDLNLSDDEATNKEKKVNPNDDLLYEYFNEEYEEDYEEEDLRAPTNKSPHQPTETESSDPSRKETPISRDLPTYLSNLTASHFLLMAASALISFILFTVAFIICCSKRRDSLQRKKIGNMPFVVDPSFFGKHPQKSNPSNFVQSSSTSIVKNYQRVPTSTKEFLSDSSPTSCSSLENPYHLPHLMEVGNGETKKPLLP